MQFAHFHVRTNCQPLDISYARVDIILIHFFCDFDNNDLSINRSQANAEVSLRQRRDLDRMYENQ